MRWYLSFFCILLAFLWSANVFAQCTNVAIGKPVTASGVYLGNVPPNAVDGNCGTSWNSSNFAPQFIQVDLQGTYTINNINVMFDMSPNGNVNHQVLVSPDMVTWSVADVITGFYVTGQLIERCYSNAPLTNVRGVRISSFSSPSWIAIIEMGIYTLSTPTTPIITPSGPLTFCAGGSVTLTSSAASSYLWSTGATTQSITVSTSGTYSVTTSQAPSCVAGSLPCTTCGTGTASTTVTVNPLPVINTGPPQTVCTDETATLTVSGNYSANATFQWTGPNGYGSTDENPSIPNITAAHAGSYIVTVTDNGCPSLGATAGLSVEDCFLPPVLDVPDNNNYCGNNHCQIVSPNLTISDPDNVGLDGAMVYFNTGYVTGEDVLQFTAQFGITGNFNPATGVITFSGHATAAQYEQVLRSVCYINTSALTTQGQREVYFVLGELLFNSTNGHYYKLVNHGSNICWTAARAAAAASTYFGMQGYLVTVTTQAENDFLAQMIQTDTWTGGSDLAQEGVWRWVTGCEGLEDNGQGRHFFTDSPGCDHPGGGTPVGTNFNAWNVNQPDNAGCLEHYMQFVPGTGGKWNDLPNCHPVARYLVEYGCMPNDPPLQIAQSSMLDVLHIYSGTQQISICDTGTYTLPGGQTVNVSGTYSDTLQTVLGCDSIITTQLAVINCHPDIGCDLICNTDFEDTQVITPGNFTLTNHANIPCWSTTAADAQMEVWGTGFNGVPAYSGNQFIELNANLVSTIYQDFQALPGSTVSISFAHRGRQGVDVMSVSIGPVGGPYIDLGTYSTGNTAWQYYTVPYTFPAIAQVDYSLRFNSISATGGSPGSGNFLDAISITMPAIDATVSAIQPGCPQAADGAISLTVTGGTPPLTVAWAPPIAVTTLQVTGLTEGDYPFTITDTYGCEHTDTVTLTEQFLAAASAQTIDICTGETYTLPGGTTVSLAGTYIDTLQTTNGCDSIVSTELTLLPVHAIAATPVICDGESFMLPDGTSVTTSGTYIATLTNGFGCDSIITTQLTVNPSPVIDVPVSICYGQSYLAQGAMQDVAGVYYDTLSTSLGCDSVIITQLTIEPIITNTLDVAICTYDSVLTAGYWKSVIGTYNDTLQTPLGCDSLVVTVLSHHPSPVAAITVANSCLDVPLLVQDASTISGGTVASWDWNFGNGATSTLPQPPSQLYPSAGVYTIDLIISSNNGCVDSAQADVEIYPLPIPLFSWDSVCVGLPVSFNDLSVANGPYPLTTWNWTFSDNQTSAQQNPTVLFGAAGPYSATLNVTTTVGCKADTTLGDALVYPEPVAVILPPDGHCLLDTAFFGEASTVDGQWGDSLVSWQWELESGTTSDLQTLSHVFSASGMNTVDLTVETAHGCSHSTSATVEVFARPISAFQLSETVGCEPLTVMYMDQSTIAAPYSVAQWHWQLADGEVSTERSPSYTHSYHGVDGILPDTVPVTLWVVSANGCASIDTVTSTIVVYSLPVAQFSIDPKRTDIIDPRITFTDLATPNVTHWDWRFGDGHTSSEPTMIYAYADTGTYSITFTVVTEYGCTDTAYSKVVIEPHFSFYIPNSFTPNSDRRNDVFRGNGEGYTDHFMSIFTRWGQEIYAGSGEVGWDGTFKGAPVEVGVYEYVITLRDWKGNARRYMGHVNLVR